METGLAHVHPFLAEGVVARIVEDGGERRARVVLRAGLILELDASHAPDVHLGGQVELAGFITVEHLRVKSGGDTSDPPA